MRPIFHPACVHFPVCGFTTPPRSSICFTFVPNKLLFMDACISAPPLFAQVELSCAATQAASLLRSANGRLYSSNYGPQGKRVALTTQQKSCGLKGQVLIHLSSGEHEPPETADAGALVPLQIRCAQRFGRSIRRSRVEGSCMEMFSSEGLIAIHSIQNAGTFHIPLPVPDDWGLRPFQSRKHRG